MGDDGHRSTERPPLVWRLALRCVRGLLLGVLGWRVRARRPATFPRPDEPLVVVFNHTSAVDAFLVADVLWRRMGRWVQPLVKAELFDVPALGTLVHHAGAIPVARNRGSARGAAYEDAVARLRVGGTVLVAPEATITHDGSLLPLRHGAARLALEARVDVLVVTHFGAQRGFSPVVRSAERNVEVTMVVDVITPDGHDDAASLTGRIAAVMLDRSDELRSTYPQPDPQARWWPPYAVPGSPSATARENLERYQASMTEAIAQARERMSHIAADHEVEQRISDARTRAMAAAEELTTRSRARAELLAEQGRLRIGEIALHARERAASIAEQFPTPGSTESEDAGDRRDDSASADPVPPDATPDGS